MTKTGNVSDVLLKAQQLNYLVKYKENKDLFLFTHHRDKRFLSL